VTVAEGMMDVVVDEDGVSVSECCVWVDLSFIMDVGSDIGRDSSSSSRVDSGLRNVISDS
jgi:hypothetical protein